MARLTELIAKAGEPLSSEVELRSTSKTKLADVEAKLVNVEAKLVEAEAKLTNFDLFLDTLLHFS